MIDGMSDLKRTAKEFRQMSTRFDSDYGALWCYMDPKPRPCFNPELLAEIGSFVSAVESVNGSEKGEGPVRFTVLASRTPGVFSLGGDLALFVECAKAKNRDALRRYSRSCVGIVHSGIVGYDLSVTTISLVQGDAMGGGFEAALCNNVVIAERSARFGLPEVMFNLFPGMGAYSILARRVGAVRAEKMILGGQLFDAAGLHELGVVDILAEDGEGEKAVYEYMTRNLRRRGAHRSVLKARQRVQQISLDELADIADLWVDAAMNLDEKDLRLMGRLIRAQDKIAAGGAPRAAAEGIFA
ncbi:MAG: crotonase/enoyl-CoA hydratase family protein [Deltaproteobacteria bacterium]